MKTILIHIVLCYSLGVFAQGNKAEIQSTVESYFDLLEKKEISNALDHVYPELLDMLGKDTFVNMFNQILNSPGVGVSLDGFEVDSISASFAFEKKTFAVVKYSHNMTFEVDMSNDTEGLLAPFLLGTYQRQYGEDNVTFKKPGTFIIHLDKDMYAIKSKDYEGWKVIEYEKTMSMFLDKVIPEQVREHFKN